VLHFANNIVLYPVSPVEMELMLDMFRLLGTEFLLASSSGLTILEVTHSLQTLDSVREANTGGAASCSLTSAAIPGPVRAAVTSLVGRTLLRKKVIYRCDRCQKQFTNRRALTYHLNSHFGLKPFACVECGKGFSQKSHLNVHKKVVHMRAKPHVCFHCGKSFAIASNMKKHLILHEVRYFEKDLVI
jgi:uncharacterized Zn-finger protein